MASGVAAGAQAGAAFGPWGAAIGGVLGGVADVAGGGGGPQMASGSAASYGTNLNGAGWVVNMRGTQVASASPSMSADTGIPDPSGGGAAPMQAGFGGMSQSTLLLLVGAAALVFVLKRKRGR